MACLLLASSVILPLGDVSLMRDIPDMYGSYTKITTPDELGVIDFVGDYLLHGKEIFGHNKNDRTQESSGHIQFQHQATPLNIILHDQHISLLEWQIFQKKYGLLMQPFLASGHLVELLRPPLA